MVKEEYKLNKEGLFDIYDYFRIIRKDAKLTQFDISKDLEIKRGVLSRYESRLYAPNNPLILFKYCKLFQISDEIALEFYNILCNRQSSILVNKIVYNKSVNAQINEKELLLLGKYFLKERLNRELSQNDVADEIGLSATEICRVETLKNERPTLNTLIPLCKFYQLSEDEFLEFYYKITGLEQKKHVYVSSDYKKNYKDLSEKIKSQELIIKKQQETIEKLNKQLKLVRNR